WTGSALTIAQMQDALAAFTSDDPAKNGLGTYFDGKGYDKYFIPTPAGSQRVPAGYNFIVNGPLNNVPSTFDAVRPPLPASRNPHYQLVSGGYRFQVDSMSTGQISLDNNYITETRADKIAGFKAFAATLVPGMLEGDGFFPPGTTITSISKDFT